jgi:hypothetical protein
MLVLPPYDYDREIYTKLPPELKLFFNKLWFSEQMGYACGPVGVRPPLGKKYVIRPIYNLYGNGEGGFYEWDMTANPMAPNNHPGYFWCEWFDGPSKFTEYVNDVPVATMEAAAGDRHDYSYNNDHIVMPDFIKGLSRYTLLESIGGNIIEASFRHMGVNARQESIDDYKQFDPEYDPKGIEFGINTHYVKLPAPAFKIEGHYWADPRDVNPTQ